MLTGLVNCIYSRKKRNQQQKQQLTTKGVTSFFMIKGDRNLNRGGKIRYITDAYEVNRNEKKRKLLNNKKKEKSISKKAEV